MTVKSSLPKKKGQNVILVTARHRTKLKTLITLIFETRSMPISFSELSSERSVLSFNQIRLYTNPSFSFRRQLLRWPVATGEFVYFFIVFSRKINEANNWPIPFEVIARASRFRFPHFPWRNVAALKIRTVITRKIGPVIICRALVSEGFRCGFVHRKR